MRRSHFTILLTLLAYEVRLNSMLLLGAALMAVPTVWLTLQFASSKMLIGLVLSASAFAVMLSFLMNTYNERGKRERLHASLAVPRTALFWLPLLFSFVALMVLAVVYTGAWLLFQSVLVDPSTTMHFYEIIGFVLSACALTSYFLVQFSYEAVLMERFSTVTAFIYSLIPMGFLAAFVALVWAGDRFTLDLRDFLFKLFYSGEMLVQQAALVLLLIIVFRLLFSLRVHFGKAISSDALSALFQRKG